MKRCIILLLTALLTQSAQAVTGDAGLDVLKNSAQCAAVTAGASIAFGAFWALLSKIHNSLEESNGTFGYTAYDEKTMFKLAGYAMPLMILTFPETWNRTASELTTQLARIFHN